MFVIGHRGASVAAAENTLAAFEAAVAQRADGVELDVRRTADGTLAVRHDETLADGRRLVELHREELAPHVPELSAVLDACRPLQVVNVEIKNWPDDGDFDPEIALAAAVVALLDDRGELDDGRIIVSSFHLGTIDRVKELAPGLATGWLWGVIDDVAALLDRAASHRHQAVHPHHAFVTEDLVARAHDLGLAVNTWTCNDPDRIRWLAEVGVDAVITDTPDVALKALGR
ncbi:MAG: glycerophosphodiester phosphodiesterase [Acidimicrobiia bacterium]|jgi:glycerophosphoryl diester phosphodiesterase